MDPYDDDLTRPSALSADERRELAAIWGREPRLTPAERQRRTELERRMTGPPDLATEAEKARAWRSLGYCGPGRHWPQGKADE